MPIPLLVAKAGANLIIFKTKRYIQNRKSMRKVLFFFVVFSCFSFSEPKLVKTKISDDITVLVPKTFRPMDEMDLVQRYPSVRRPVAAYTNMEREVDFSVNISATQWPDGDIAIAQKFFKAGISNLFDDVEMIAEEIREVHGQQFIFFEFESRVRGDRRELGLESPVMRYTCQQYLVQPGRTLVFSFSCPRRIRADWQTSAHKMMEGIRVR